MQKPPLSFWQIWNMSFGFFGIQFGWGLQMGNMSAIYERLGANESQLPLLWLAAPVTGLIVQPIIGYMSDRTWNRLGRRRPYFLVGAVLASLALLVMPHSGVLWMAAGLLWILDASVNVSMEPFRAFVADLLPEEQRTVGFAMQSVFIGAGAVIASLLPGWLGKWGVGTASTAEHAIPPVVTWAFTIGAVVFLVSVLWTIFTTKEYPPEDMEELRRQKSEGWGEIWVAFKEMPARMKQLAAVQFFTWMALFAMWIFFSVAVARNILGATDTSSALYQQGIDLANGCFAVYNFTAFIAAMVFLWLGRRVPAKHIHFVSLLLGGLGLMSMCLPSNVLLAEAIGIDLSMIRILGHPVSFSITVMTLAFVGVGIAWASILSMPYAMLSGALPANRTGVYMGIFNFFIVIPQILVAILLSRAMESFPQFNRLSAVVFGGAAMIVAALLTLRVRTNEGAVSA